MLETGVLDALGFTAEQRDLLEVVWHMLYAIDHGDVSAYEAACTPDLTCFEPEISPHRIDGLNFHRSLMTASRSNPGAAPIHFEMLTPSVQIYGDAGIVTYTRLRTYDDGGRMRWHSCNETRVFVRQEGQWKMAHFHRSAA
jgi:ketosteroid isomerase-like protein